MHAAGFPLVSGEGIIGAVTIALEHKLIDGVDDEVLHRYAGGLVPCPAAVGCDGCPPSAEREGVGRVRAWR